MKKSIERKFDRLVEIEDHLFYGSKLIRRGEATEAELQKQIAALRAEKRQIEKELKAKGYL